MAVCAYVDSIAKWPRSAVDSNGMICEISNSVICEISNGVIFEARENCGV